MKLYETRRATRPLRRTLMGASALLTAASLGLGTNRVEAAAFTPGNLAIFRLGGDVTNSPGGAALSGNAAPVFIDEYTTGGTFVQSIPLPTTATNTAGTQRALTQSGTSTAVGALALSADRRYLTFGGYDATVGTANVATSPAATINRVVGRIGSNGVPDTSTALTDAYDANSFRSVVSDNGTNLFLGGNATTTGGVRFATFGTTGTSTQISSTVVNVRVVNIFQSPTGTGNQLYTSAMSGAFRVATVGNGVPTTSGETITNLPGLPIAGNSSPYGFVLFDLNPTVDGADTLYIADDASVVNGGGVQKYSRTVNGGNFTLNGNLTTVASRGLTGVAVGNTVTLYATTGATAANTLITLTDTTGNGGTVTAGTPTVLATAPANTVFRGVAFAPDVASSVELISFAAKSYTDGIFVQWRTGLETDNLGFWVYRQDRLTQANGKMAWSRPYKLNPALIAGAALQNNANSAPDGGFAYGWRDTRPMPKSGLVRYWLQDVETGGKITTHGPVRPAPARGSLSSLKVSPMVTQLIGR